MRGIFGGDKGEGSIKNEKTYAELPLKLFEIAPWQKCVVFAHFLVTNKICQGPRSHLHFTVKMTPPKIASNFIITYFFIITIKYIYLFKSIFYKKIDF